MSVSEALVKELEMTAKYLRVTASAFEEADSTYAPQADLYTVAGHVAHAADSVDWFVEGAFGSGWDMEFEKLIAKAKAVTSLEDALAWFQRAFDNAGNTIVSSSEEDLYGIIQDQNIMAGAPRLAIVGAIVDHTAHHRGALAVYARLLGKEPPMPYA